MEDRRVLRAIEGAMKGDEASFAQLMQMKARSILYIATSLMHDKADGEDIAQEAAIMIRRDIGKLKSAEAFDSWMYRTIFNACMNAKRKMERISNISDLGAEAMDVPEKREDFLPAEFVENAEKRSELVSAVHALSDRAQMCVLMYYFEDMSYEEIADVLDIKVYDVANTLSRAKKKLRSILVDPEQMLESAVRPRSGFALAGVPVLAAALEKDAEESIPQSMIDRFLDGIAKPLGTGAVLGAASLISRLGGATLVIAAALAVTITVGTAIVFGTASDDSSDTPIADTAASTAGQDATGEGAGSTSNADDAANPAHAVPLAAVLDAPQAAAFEGFAEGQHPKQDWDEFMARNGMYRVRYILDREYQYTVYEFDNTENNTKLLAIERQSSDGSVEIAYATGGEGIEAPTGSAIIEAFGAWKK